MENNEINEVVSFHNLSYGDKRTAKDWIWEYKGHYPDLFVFTVIEDNHKVVGTQGMIPIYLNIRGKKHLSGKSENSLLDNVYRGKGLFTQLYDFALSLCKAKKMCCVWGFTGEISAIKVLSRVGFSVYEDAVYTSMLILKPRQFMTRIHKSKQNIVREAAKSLAVMLLCLYSATRGFTYRCLRRTSGEFSIEQKLRSSSDITELYRRFREKYGELIHTELDEKYIAWRILGNPNVEYATYFVYKDNLLKAYCFVALPKSGEAFLSDLTFEDYEAGCFLLKEILRRLSRSKVITVYFMGNIRNPLLAAVFDLLRNNGFVKRDSTSFVLKSVFWEDAKFLTNIRNWYINGLWTEGFKF